MIDRINWLGDNPFSTDTPLRITFHIAGLTDLSDQEAEAYKALQELAHLPEIDAIQSAPGELPYFQVGNYDNSERIFPYEFVIQDNVVSRSYINFRNPNEDVLISRFASHQASETERKTILDDITAVAVHKDRREYRHLFVTTRSYLIKNKDEVFIRYANPCNPLDAARIVGLFLRSKKRLAYSAKHNFTRTASLSRFYSVLALQYLPCIWRYWGACAYSYESRKNSSPEDDILELGSSFRDRIQRVLQARDEIGSLFYGTQTRENSDQILDRFDYLMLLLSGIFDTQALIAYRSYNLARPQERNAVFQNQEFQKHLNQSAPGLYQVITDPDFDNVISKILGTLRNTIHGVGLRPICYESTFYTPGATYLRITNQDRLKTLTDALKNHPLSLSDWGFNTPSEFEPYTFVSTLIRECFNLVCKIADATEVEKLFPPSVNIPNLTNTNHNDRDEEDFAKHVAVLG